MWLSTTVNAYDVMGEVHIAAVVRGLSDGPLQEFENVLQCETTIQGIGETDPRLWLKDALIGLLEAL